MKSLSLLLASVLGLLILTPSTARADHGRGSSCRVSSCGRCGGEVRWVYSYSGRDCYGRPVYRWVQSRHFCPPPRCDDHSRYDERRYDDRRYDDRRHDERGSRSRFGISLRFGR